jgi:uncharacterized membrane protein YjgN (DUF898 family)
MNFQPSLSQPGRAASVRFTGVNGDFRRLVTRGAMLGLVTFGFYRFWLTTDIRRHLWANTEVDGDALEYTGRGKELFLGFLIALAILAPLFLGYFLIGIAFEREKTFASLPLYAALYLFGQFAVYRARRYRLTRTVWRGVRFWMTGSGWSYAWRALLWQVLVVVTLGIAYPWQMAALERYKLGHTFYGRMPGRFEATGGQLFARVWWVCLLGLLPFALLLFGSAQSIMDAAPQAPLPPPGRLASLFGVLGLLALPFLHAMRKATEWRWWVGGIRFRDVSVTCNLPRGGLIGVYWKLIGVSLLMWLVVSIVGGLIGGAVFVSLGPTASAALTSHPPAWAFAAIGAFYLATALAFGVVFRIYTVQRIWQRVVNRCALQNAEAAIGVAGAGAAASAIGEGLADGLDFAGF